MYNTLQKLHNPIMDINEAKKDLFLGEIERYKIQ